ncbi:MAG TPA: PBP1A family penicillin-binding protein, partial [Longimicrobiales bacterium]|nr:PBP1A family penicillin-binding protein [Longimicrobiales bacterium]
MKKTKARDVLRRAAAGARKAAGRLKRIPLHYVVAAVAVALLAGGLLYRNCGLDGCPDVEQLTAYQPGGAPVLLDRHGEKFADLAPYERVVVSLDSLPPHVANAFIAVEDRRFWRHRGVDWSRVIGAALANVRARGIQQGSSTIPMQLARNIFPRELPGSERTFRRKLQEARVAQKIEGRFSKSAILEMYLNHIYFGGGAYGVEAASRLYFGKAARELTLAEAAVLAALPKAPTHYDPRRRPERSRERRDLVLTLMERQGLVDAAAADSARATDLAARTNGGRDRTGIPLGAYFIDVVRDALEDRFGESLYRSRLQIHTTLDPVAQRAAETELENQLKSLEGRVRRGAGELQGAMVVMEAATGDVLALVGGRDPSTSRYNRATNGRRQVGSAFKPFVFAAALDEGIPTSQLVLDAPLRMQLSRNDVWEPSNFDGIYEGEVSLRRALVRSRNIPTVRLASAVGIDDVARTARTAGVSERMDETPALALGTVAMSPLQLATAYTTFATLGRTATPQYVLRVEDESGRLLWQPERRVPRRGMDPGVAYLVTDILRDAVDYGTGTGVRAAGFRGAVAGKTGTTNNATDAWFVGYTPDLVGSVWIGYDQPSALGGAATGGGFAAPVWGRVMRQIYRERTEPEPWRVPAGVIRHRIDPYTGLVLQDGCEPRGSSAATEIFISRNVPATACPYRDFWSDFWNRVGGVFGGGAEERSGRDRVIGGSRDIRVESESPRPPQGPGRAEPRPPATGDRQIEEFLRQRSEELRRQQERARRQPPGRARSRDGDQAFGGPTAGRRRPTSSDPPAAGTAGD